MSTISGGIPLFTPRSGGSGGGGGGAFVNWQERASAPGVSYLTDLMAYEFIPAGAQYLYAFIKVPSSYQAGNQIKLLGSWLSFDSSGTVLFTTQSTLIRAGTDVYTSTTNQRTSTNAAVTTSGATDEIPQTIEFDLTDASGNINSVAVSAGDLIKIRLTRGTDTAADSAYFYNNASEVTFA